ncbi:MAG: sodium/hydrogen exchanger [Armatimonadetes bacterium]|nr:sodium/hydrogen exchanger [Armatimonadota bacterium]
MSDAHKTEAVLLAVILQLVVIIAVARLAGILSRRLGHPMVVGEVLAGLLLGPSVLGRLLPTFSEALFPASTSGVINIISQIGLILLLFLIGLEFDFGHIRSHGKTAAVVAISGIALPFALGLALAHWMQPYFPGVNPTGFSLFIATAHSITAIPVLGRVLVEFNIQRTQIGTLTITSAAIDDALGWVLLAAVAAIVGSKFDPLAAARMVLLTLVFGGVMVLVVRPLLIRWIRGEMRRQKGQLSLNGLALVFVVMFACAAITNLIGIFSIFGAFVLGAVLYDQQAFREAVFQRLKDFVTAFFLPIYFTFTGLHTDMGTLGTGVMWGFLAALLVASFLGKFVGCGVAARFSGLAGREAACVGIMMNTRGLMGLIAANVGLQMGAIPTPVYCMLVLMCVFSTVLLSPVLRRLIPGTELEEPFRRSEFAQEGLRRTLPAVEWQGTPGAGG